jgi:Arc/MetJ-type ribon-helix-helix transcriptional regulator
MKNVSIKLPEALDANLNEAVRRRGLSKSEIVREALQAYLAGKNGHQAESCLDLARDLWGSLEGPADLSHNRKHLEGYGQ